MMFELSILLQLFALTVGMIWGLIIYRFILIRSIKNGKLPKDLESKREELAALLKKEKEKEVV